MESLYWLILFVILIVIEIITLGLTTIWFAGGALVAFVAAIAGANLVIQLVLFFLVSIVLLLSTRPAAVRLLNKDRTKTNADSLIGKTAVVTETINNLQGEGEVVINGQEWMARTEEDDILIEKDKLVEIIDIRGVKLIVKENKEEL